MESQIITNNRIEPSFQQIVPVSIQIENDCGIRPDAATFSSIGPQQPHAMPLSQSCEIPAAKAQLYPNSNIQEIDLVKLPSFIGDATHGQLTKLLSAQASGTYVIHISPLLPGKVTVSWKSRQSEEIKFLTTGNLKTLKQHIAVLVPLNLETLTTLINAAKECHGYREISPEQVKELIRGEPEGTYLIRPSTRYPGCMVAEYRHAGTEIATLFAPSVSDMKWVMVGEKELFASLNDLSLYFHQLKRPVCSDTEVSVHGVELSESLRDLCVDSPNLSKLMIIDGKFVHHFSTYYFTEYVPPEGCWAHKGVQELTLNSCGFGKEHAFSELLSHFPSLKKLQIRHCKFEAGASDLDYALEKMRGIEVLFSNCERVSQEITVEGFQEIPKPFTRALLASDANIDGHCTFESS